MTPQASHTPGPWAIGDKEESAPHTSHILGGGHKVCTVESYPYSTTGKADARLIAAAPELLDACEKAGSVSEGFITTATVNQLRTQLRIVQQAAKAAITKATQPEGGR